MERLCNFDRIAEEPTQALRDTAEHAMKIYLLMTLFGILFTAIHLTSTPKQDPKPVSQ
jgi:hypothetical protein